MDFVTKVLVTANFFDNGQLLQKNRLSDNGSSGFDSFSVCSWLFLFFLRGKKFPPKVFLPTLFLRTLFLHCSFFSIELCHWNSVREETLLKMKAGEQLKPVENVVGGGEGADDLPPTPSLPPKVWSGALKLKSVARSSSGRQKSSGVGNRNEKKRISAKINNN